MSGDVQGRPNTVILDEALVSEIQKEGRISDQMMATMDAAIGEHRLELKRPKTFFTHARVSAKKRAAARKAERQNKRKGR